MSARPIGLAVLLLALLTAGARADVEDWLSSVVNRPTPESKLPPPALVLLDETRVEINAHGQAETTHRWAIRILHLSARDRAVAQVSYDGAADRISYAEAWLWRKGSTVKLVKQREWVDLADNALGAVVDDNRQKVADCKSQAVVGDVLAYETRVRGALFAAQLGKEFSHTLPILTDRLIVSVPAGFKVRSQLFGNSLPAADVAADGRTWTWTATDRAYRRDEPECGPSAFVDAELFVWIDPPAGATDFAPKRFASWAEVAAWNEQLNDDSCDTSPALAAKARELAAPATDSLEKIRALGAYVQGTRYIAINRGLRAGLGYKARKASSVFATGYGDCKDKANLLRAMLREVGIRAHLVSARVGDDLEVHPEFPSPLQFDHAIAGIEVDAGVDLPAALSAGQSGRLLLFDPTNEFIPVGDLPEYLQGTRIFVIARDSTGLVEAPTVDPALGHCVMRKATMVVSADLAAQITGTVTGMGVPGGRLRARIKEADLPRKLDELTAEELSEGFRGAVVQQRATHDDRLHDQCSLSFTCAKPGVVQPLAGGLFVVKLDVLSHHYLPVLADKERTLPVRLDPLVIDDEITLEIPPGQRLDELPAPANLTSAYGHYQIAFEAAAGKVIARRRVEIRKLEVPAADYAKLKAFLGAIARADRCSVILKRGE